MARQNLLTSVVVPTDFSEGAQKALERALRLPLSPKAKLTLLHVIPDDIPGTLRKQAIDESERSIEKMIARAHTLAMEKGISPIQFVGDVVEGAAAHQIMKRARTVEADVIVIGRHGRRPVVDLFVGTTAQRVVRDGEVPVLLVQAPTEAAYKSALVSVDLERTSAAVLKAARPLLTGVDTTVFHASRVPFEDYVTMSGELTQSYREEFVTDAKKDLAALVKKSGLEAREVAVSGDPRILILDEARQLGAELIVVGTHARKGLQRFLVGSVAEWVLRHARCDVLVVRA